jgi:glutaconate CoA-transferase subunit A
MGVPFLPTKAQLGSDLMTYAPDQLRACECPFTGGRLAAVRAITPDVAILHAHYADRLGNTRKDGSLGMDRAGAHAARHVIVTVEKIVDSDFIRAQPERTLLPGLLVDAVVELPWGAYPLHLNGCYGSALAGFRQAVQTRENYEQYLRQWVYGLASGQSLPERIAAIQGADHVATLRSSAARRAREEVPA